MTLDEVKWLDRGYYRAAGARTGRECVIGCARKPRPCKEYNEGDTSASLFCVGCDHAMIAYGKKELQSVGEIF